MCEHKWIYQMSNYESVKVGYYTCEYSRIDTYYCEKCCEIKEKVNKCEAKDIKEGKPYWWK